MQLEIVSDQDTIMIFSAFFSKLISCEVDLVTVNVISHFTAMFNSKIKKVGALITLTISNFHHLQVPVKRV